MFTTSGYKARKNMKWEFEASIQSFDLPEKTSHLVRGDQVFIKQIRFAFEESNYSSFQS